jgi:hypothetical protein
MFPETDVGHAAGREYLARVSTRLASGERTISAVAGKGQLIAVAKLQSIPFDQTRANLESIKQPVLYATACTT